jgi:hypothetical protein
MLTASVTQEARSHRQALCYTNVAPRDDLALATLRTGPKQLHSTQDKDAAVEANMLPLLSWPTHTGHAIQVPGCTPAYMTTTEAALPLAVTSTSCSRNSTALQLVHGPVLSLAGPAAVVADSATSTHTCLAAHQPLLAAAGRDPQAGLLQASWTGNVLS